MHVYVHNKESNILPLHQIGEEMTDDQGAWCKAQKGLIWEIDSKGMPALIWQQSFISNNLKAMTIMKINSLFGTFSRANGRA